MHTLRGVVSNECSSEVFTYNYQKEIVMMMCALVPARPVVWSQTTGRLYA